jgi:hypothetical protein
MQKCRVRKRAGLVDRGRNRNPDNRDCGKCRTQLAEADRGPDEQRKDQIGILVLTVENQVGDQS